MTYKDIEASLRIGSGSVAKILHIYLRVSKVSSRWVPHSLTDGQKVTRVEWCCEMILRFTNGNSEIITGDETWIYQYDPETKHQSSVWVFPNDDRPVKVKRANSVGKKLVLTFFAAGDHVATISLEHQRTVTAQWYTTVALPQVFQKLREKRPRAGLRGILLHHDSASAHTTHLTMDFSKGDSCAAVDPSSIQSRPGTL